MRKSFTVLFVFAVLFFSACTKEEIFIDGAAGAKGEQGLNGDAGLKGANGTALYNGTGAPSHSLGALGDYYFDKNTTELYGPKAADGWPTPLSLKGNAGATGLVGLTGSAGQSVTQILSGTGAPTQTLGNLNDFYFDTTNMDFYGPKTANSWGTALPLVASNGITTFLFNQQNFDDISLYDESTDADITSYTYYGLKSININHPNYTNAYQTGIVLVQYKFSDDPNSYWLAENTTYDDTQEIGEVNYLDIYSWYEGAITGKGINVEGKQSTQTDPNGDLLRNTRFDVKVVCIAAGTALQMQAKKVNIKDATAVAKYLNL